MMNIQYRTRAHRKAARWVFIFTLFSFTVNPVGAEIASQSWMNSFDGSANSTDSADSILVDPDGNLVVLVSSKGEDTGLDFVTIKYDPYGNQLWQARYDGSHEQGWDYAKGMAIDDSGNIYVTGCSLESLNKDFATVKYDTNGNELWVVRYNGPDNLDDYPEKIAVDRAGSLLVIGYSMVTPQTAAYATVKYDGEGNQLWVARYKAPGDGNDRAKALAIDAFDNIYVTGSSYRQGTDDDYATIKYDSAGNQLWVTHYNGPGDREDYARAIGLDEAGNVYVTGYSNTAQDIYDYIYDYVTVKYDPDGHELWVASYDGPAKDDDRAGQLVVDGSGNVLVTGYSSGGDTKRDYTTIKYDSGGNQLWIARYNGKQSSDDEPAAMTVDSAGNVYVAGSTMATQRLEWLCDHYLTDCWFEFVDHASYGTVKYDPDGKQLWEITCYKGLDNFARSLVLDKSENVYVTGMAVYAIDGDTADGSNVDTIKYTQLQNIPGWESAEVVEASALASYEAGNSNIVNFSLMLIFPLLTIIVRKISTRQGPALRLAFQSARTVLWLP